MNQLWLLQVLLILLTETNSELSIEKKFNFGSELFIKAN